MLQQGSAARCDRRDDLHLRMHLLSRMRRDAAGWALSELRWKFRLAADSSARGAREVSALERASLQARWMRLGAIVELAGQSAGMRITVRDARRRCKTHFVPSDRSSGWASQSSSG